MAEPGDDLPFVRADRDVYVSYGNQYFYGPGGPPFTIEAAADRPAAALEELRALRDRPSVLLDVRRQAIPFAGRTEELAGIRAWRDDLPLRAAWVIHAAGGQGKTRLVEWAGRQAVADGWDVGHAVHRDETPRGGKRLQPRRSSPLFLVVDYAERWPLTDLHAMLGECAAAAGRFRVLLLARSLDWWPATAAECAKLDIVTDRAPRLLTGLAADEAGRRVLFDVARRRYAEIFELGDLPAQSPAGSLSDPAYGLTLGLHMAALAAVDAYARAASPPNRPTDLSRYLLDRERNYWSKLYGTDEVRTAGRTVFVAALAGPRRPAEGLALLEHLGMPRAADTSAQKLIDAHARCYPPSSGFVLEPMYPDRLAEDFIALTLPGGPPSGHDDTWAETVIVTAEHGDRYSVYRPGPLFTPGEGISPAHLSRVLIFLAAAASRATHIAERLGYLLGGDPALAVDAGGAALLAVVPYLDYGTADMINQYLPKRSVDLAPGAAAIAELLVRLVSPAAPLEVHARNRNRLAVRLADAGRPEEALTAGTEAAEMYRRLAETDPDTHLADFAVTLTNLSNLLAGIGQWEEALRRGEEADEIFRRLARSFPGAYLPDLASSSDNLGRRLSDLGRHNEALASSEEAVKTHRRLTRTDPAHLPDLASALISFSVRLISLKRWAEGLPIGQEAVTIFRRLAQANPDVYLPELALSLHNLGVLWAGLGEWDEALAPTVEAVTIHRRLTEVNPHAYQPDLAMSLRNLGGRLSDLGRADEALPPSREAVDLYRRLAATNPGAYRPALASALKALGVRLSRQGATAEAIPAIEEAVQIYRQLAQINPGAYRPDLAGALNDVAVALSRSGRAQEGLGPSREAVAIRRSLVETNPSVFLPDLAISLAAFAHVRASADEELEEAWAAVTEAERLFAELAEDNDMYRWTRLGNLTVMADVLDRLEMPDQAARIRDAVNRLSGHDEA